MWNSDQKKPTSPIEDFFSHLEKEKPRKTKRKIIPLLSFIALILSGGAYMFGTNEKDTLPSSSSIALYSGIPINTAILSGEISLPQQKLCIKHPNVLFFMYHYVRENDPRDTPVTRDLSVTPSLFREHMKVVHNLAQSGSITLMKGEDFIDAYKSGCFPGNPIWIFTSDDGWKDTYTDLIPIAHEYSVPFFIGIIGNQIGKKGFVSSGEILDIIKDPLFTISSHSMNHRDESTISADQEYYEMCDSKKLLEELTGKSIDTYIYPSGKMNSGSSEENFKKCGYSFAWTTNFGETFDWNELHLDEIDRIRISHETSASLYTDLFGKYLELESGGLLKNLK